MDWMGKDERLLREPMETAFLHDPSFNRQSASMYKPLSSTLKDAEMKQM